MWQRGVLRHNTNSGFGLGLTRVADLGGGGARLDMAIKNLGMLLVTMASPPCLPCHPTMLHEHSHRRSWARKLVSGSRRVDNNSICTGAESGGGGVQLVPDWSRLFYYCSTGGTLLTLDRLVG